MVKGLWAPNNYTTYGRSPNWHEVGNPQLYRIFLCTSISFPLHKASSRMACLQWKGLDGLQSPEHWLHPKCLHLTSVPDLANILVAAWVTPHSNLEKLFKASSICVTDLNLERELWKALGCIVFFEVYNCTKGRLVCITLIILFLFSLYTESGRPSAAVCSTVQSCMFLLSLVSNLGFLY